MRHPSDPAEGTLRVRTPHGRWRRRERRLAAITYVGTVLLLSLLCVVSVGTLSAARAFSGGESLYSKGQKNAVRHLRDYFAGREPAALAAFDQALQVPLGDGLAQRELDKDSPDYAVVRRAFAQGGVADQDILSMMVFYRAFSRSPLVSPIIQAWRRGDANVARMAALAREARAHFAASPEPLPPRFGQTLDAIDDALDRDETIFSRQLGAASRWIENTLLVATLLLAAVLAFAGVVFARAMWNHLGSSQLEIEEGNARWALAAEAGAFGLVRWDSAGDRVSMDDRARDIWGFPPGTGGVVDAELLRRRVHPGDLERLTAASSHAALTGSHFAERVRLVLDDQAVRHVELTGRGVSSRVGATDIVGLLRDVTSEVQAQDVKMEEGAAERTYLAKREFLSRVSHELRTPLNAVIGFSELMKADAEDPLSTGQSARLARVVDGGHYLLRLVNDLLDAAKMEAGELSVALKDVVLAPVLQGAVDLLEPARAARGIAFAVDRVDEHLRVVGDPTRLRQVFVNLLSNAVKYNRPNGRVDVTCAFTADEVSVTIADEGVGMTPQQQRELFIPFRRPAAGSHRTEGAGLGLVITRHLVERQGGRLEIRSVPRQGTSVTVHLARDGSAVGHEFPESGRVELAAATQSNGRELVLYVEDDPVNILLVEQYAAVTADVDLVVARDGRSGLEAIRKLKPALVLLDMQLPDMTGLQVLDAVRADPALVDLKVVALSADAMPDQVDEALRRGAVAYWTKPLQLGEFRQRLGKVLHPSDAANERA